ncbi:hypothetical protein [Sporomusa aerivorans]|uniref:hypothetical protein n=1 Tax=Sporomusa aerivorans TaxID=204936 RepID=UPI00352BCBA3
MIKKGDIVRLIYKSPPWEDYFWKIGEVELSEERGGTEVIHVKFSDRTIGCTRTELQKVRKN